MVSFSDLLFFATSTASSSSSNFSSGQGMGMGGFDITYLILIGVISVISMAVSGMLKAKFNQHSKHAISLSGAEIAQRMLNQNGIQDVQVIAVRGRLTDHYNPMDKTVNLSEAVYHQRNAAAAAVAAHEVGHALQHAQAYPALKMRSALVPLLSRGAGMAPMIIMVGLVIMGASQAAGGGLGFLIAMAGVGLFSLTTLFSFVTLPVEFDASKRAMVWIEKSGVMDSVGHERAKNALFWAAMTYVVAALASMAQLAYFLMRVLNSRR